MISGTLQQNPHPTCKLSKGDNYLLHLYTFFNENMQVKTKLFFNSEEEYLEKIILMHRKRKILCTG